MQTRRDHVQAYQFAMARLSTALVTGDSGRGEPPARRSRLGMFFGAGLAALLCAGFGVFGLISPGGNTSWRQPHTVIVEKETGNRYLYLGGELRPVRNYASALLIAGEGATVRTVSRNSLAGVPHGTPVGIPNAPDTLPSATQLLLGAWTRCVRDDPPNGLLLDFHPAGRIRPFPADRQVVLSSTSGDLYLLWHGTKYPLPDDASRIALGLDTQQQLVAPRSWLSAVPTGARLVPASVPGVGRPGRTVGGRPARIGQVFTAMAGTGGHSYVLRADGLEPVSATEGALLSTRRGAPAPRRVDQSYIAAAPVSKDHALMKAVPDVLGARQQPLTTEALCLREQTTSGVMHTQVVLEGGQAAIGKRFVLVPPGRGVVALDNSDTANLGTPQRYLITEQGRLYPIGRGNSALYLGLPQMGGLPLPRDVLGLLPKGPELDAAAALATVRGG
ncbi:type VII secretion protein EccB [Streptomyces sp. NPDC006668]|uniref:type VII secretion protein EccB n=1 Tax=Streptomyces sp. NPDC006668 TaxID=3156903 RepID=UPI0033C7FF28